tara:strand:+ start:318 stop:569 length:252 start_codon:yes stop_codon:yes gene_type:complete
MKVNKHKKDYHKSTVEIFRTNVGGQQLANKVISGLNQIYPDYHINFDLEDCDKVLRIENQNDIDVLGVLNYGKNQHIKIELIA